MPDVPFVLFVCSAKEGEKFWIFAHPPSSSLSVNCMEPNYGTVFTTSPQYQMHRRLCGSLAQGFPESRALSWEPGFRATSVPSLKKPWLKASR